jgi:hypothetical protein
MIKKYQKFVEEITIKGNAGVPGESGDPNDPKYLQNVERRAKQRMGIERSSPADIMRYWPEIMGLVRQSQGMTRGKEKELEDLALEVIMDEYQSILDNVELDIKLVRPGAPAEILDGGTPAQPPMMRLTSDPDLKMEVDKAKLLNNVIQGEAKNTKNILHSDIVKDGLTKIFGEESGRLIFDIWDRISKIADKLDWIVPIEAKADMMEQDPMGMAGAVKVEWNTKEDDKKDKEDLAAKILKELEEGKDISDNEEEISDLMDDISPKIIARGIDFPMLLHETVKGIYELIAANSIPDDEEFATKIQTNVNSFADEAEDFRYGPEIAADLRDFVNSILEEMSKTDSDIRNIRNVREFFFGKICDRGEMSTQEFLTLFKGILKGDNDAKIKSKRIISEIIKELKGYERSIPLDFESPDMETSKSDNLSDNDYTKMSKKDILSEIDIALDSGDFDKARELTITLNKVYPEK